MESLLNELLEAGISNELVEKVKSYIEKRGNKRAFEDKKCGLVWKCIEESGKNGIEGYEICEKLGMSKGMLASMLVEIKKSDRSFVRINGKLYSSEFVRIG